MTMLLVGLAVFLGMHSVSIFAPQWRGAMVSRMGTLPWKGLYSAVSIVGFALLWKGYALARLEPIPVYVPPAGLRHVAALLMLPVFPLLLAAYLPGRIKALAVHPMLVAVKLWAVSHLLANGMLADIVLFGAFLAWAVMDRISLKRRAPANTPSLPRSAINDAIVVIGGLALYGVFVGRWHEALIGVAPFGG
jgi:uncharacterized membrane protein